MCLQQHIVFVPCTDTGIRWASQRTPVYRRTNRCYILHVAHDPETMLHLLRYVPQLLDHGEKNCQTHPAGIGVERTGRGPRPYPAWHRTTLSSSASWRNGPFSPHSTHAFPMSLLDGEHCAYRACGTLSFLPIACPQCTARFCEKHAQPEQHACVRPLRVPTPCDTMRRRCELPGCPRWSLQVEGTALAHRAPRCERCQGLFCMRHRSAIAHKCTAPPPPTAHQQRQASAAARRAKSQAITSKHFPSYHRN